MFNFFHAQANSLYMNTRDIGFTDDSFVHIFINLLNADDDQLYSFQIELFAFSKSFLFTNWNENDIFQSNTHDTHFISVLIPIKRIEVVQLLLIIFLLLPHFRNKRSGCRASVHSSTPDISYNRPCHAASQSWHKPV